MAHIWCKYRPPQYERFAERETPQWFKDGKLGIFIHWGPYSVPAWAEPTGELGSMPGNYFPHNPYAEWYFNTMRYADSPTAKRHKEVHGDCAYDDFIDQWKAKDFDADKMAKLFRRAGAKYIVPVSKHHDGVTLWDAPETNGRNTVRRGPKRDLIKEWADACDKEDLKFGVYYSTGIDWHFWPTKEPWSDTNELRPGLDAHEYNEYAWKHCKDLIDKYKPYVLWGDIDWPKAGVAPGKHSVEALLDELYTANPEAVINDRFGDTHFDFRTVEYGLGEAPSDETMWQYTRGLGYSYGYNQVEDESQTMSGLDAVRLLADVASDGGDLLLNVGPDADGNLPPVQLRTIEQLGDWMEIYSDAIHGTHKVDAAIATPLAKKAKKVEAGAPWLRWTQKDGRLFAIYEAAEPVEVPADAGKVDIASAKSLSGEAVAVQDGKLVATDLAKGPAVVEFRIL